MNAFVEKSLADKVILEINASRHAYNISMEDVLKTVVKVFIKFFNPFEVKRASHCFKSQ